MVDWSLRVFERAVALVAARAVSGEAGSGTAAAGLAWDGDDRDEEAMEPGASSARAFSSPVGALDLSSSPLAAASASPATARAATAAALARAATALAAASTANAGSSPLDGQQQQQQQRRPRTWLTEEAEDDVEAAVAVEADGEVAVTPSCEGDESRAAALAALEAVERAWVARTAPAAEAAPTPPPAKQESRGGGWFSSWFGGGGAAAAPAAAAEEAGARSVARVEEHLHLFAGAAAEGAAPATPSRGGVISSGRISPVGEVLPASLCAAVEGRGVAAVHAYLVAISRDLVRAWRQRACDELLQRCVWRWVGAAALARGRTSALWPRHGLAAVWRRFIFEVLRVAEARRRPPRPDHLDPRRLLPSTPPPLLSVKAHHLSSTPAQARQCAARLRVRGALRFWRVAAALPWASRRARRATYERSTRRALRLLSAHARRRCAIRTCHPLQPARAPEAVRATHARALP